MMTTMRELLLTGLLSAAVFAQSGNLGPFTNSGDVGGPSRKGTTEFDAASGQYVFNWSTKGLASGRYRLYIDLGDGTPHTVDLGLK